MEAQEVLKLHEKTEAEQITWLRTNGTMGLAKRCYIEIYDIRGWESLADCAFRLRDEIGGFNKINLEYIDIIYKAVTGDEEGLAWNKLVSWLLSQKPIHWIQAVLLTKIES